MGVTTVVRDARPTDIPWLIPQLLTFLSSLGLPLRPTEDHVTKSLERLMNQGVVLVAENSETGHLLGTIGGQVDFHFADPERLVLAELWWWVAPEHRGSTAGLRLLQAFRERGLQDVDLVTLCTLTTTHPRVGEHLERMGFQHRERAYILDVEAVLREGRNMKPTNGTLAQNVVEGGV